MCKTLAKQAVHSLHTVASLYMHYATIESFNDLQRFLAHSCIEHS